MYFTMQSVQGGLCIILDNKKSFLDMLLMILYFIVYIV